MLSWDGQGRERHELGLHTEDGFYGETSRKGRVKRLRPHSRLPGLWITVAGVR